MNLESCAPGGGRTYPPQRFFALFTIHARQAAAWIEAGCAYIHSDDGSLLKAEVAGDKLACLRKTYGGSLGELAGRDAAGLPASIVVEVQSVGFPDSGACYDALRAYWGARC